MAEALIELVGSYGDAADAEPGESCLRRADAIATRLGDPIITSEFLRARALHGWLRRDYDAALSRAAEAAELSIRIGSVNNVLGTPRLVGHVMEETGNIAAAAEIHAFVAGHPASLPFSRARAQAALHHAAAALSEAEVQRIRERIGSAQLGEFTASVLARIAPAGVQLSARP